MSQTDKGRMNLPGWMKEPGINEKIRERSRKKGIARGRRCSRAQCVSAPPGLSRAVSAHRRFFRSATQPTMMCDAERVLSAGLNRAAAERMALSCAAFRADPTKILYQERTAREP